jgi:GT2 family glycosyltransferase
MTFTIMITTYNRCADLRRTCAALTLLSPPPDEVLICADGCEDETVSMVTRCFSWFIVLENAERQGSVASRDRMLRLASSDIVISLDDDSYPVAPDFLARVS